MVKQGKTKSGDMAQEAINFSKIVGQQAIWNRLASIFKRDRIGSAYLFHGASGSGKEATAIQFATLLNCGQANDMPCFKCSSCRKFNSLQHPNLNLVIPLPREKAIAKNDLPIKALSSKTLEILTDQLGQKGKDPYIKLQLPRAQRILINSIREIREKVYLKAVVPGWKIILIFQSEKLMLQQGESANALLKILEEPPEGTTLILCTEYHDRLSETIRSRCQSIFFPSVSEYEIVSHLQNECNTPEDEAFLIAHLSQGNVRMARRLITSDISDITSMLQSILSWAVSGTEHGWRRFLAHVITTYRSSPVEWALQLQLLSYWFRDALHAQKLKGDSKFILSILEKEIREFSNSFPNADYYRIIAAIEKCGDSLNRNYQLNFVIMNLLMEIRDGLSTKK